MPMCDKYIFIANTKNIKVLITDLSDRIKSINIRSSS